MNQRFDFGELIPDLQWYTMMMMGDEELVNLCRSSHEMKRFCNTRDWFWKQRSGAKFGIDLNNNKTIQSILKREKSWFRVYFVLMLINRLKNKLKPLEKYTLIEIYNLNDLYLRGNQLNELPSQIGQLINLEFLDLRYNKLTKLPPQIGQLVNLKFLDLFRNQLKELPPQIGQLVNLQHLDLRYNKLTKLPPQIEQLTNLKSLDLRYNQLTELPPQIGKLVNLQELWLYNNQLKELPPQIGKLTNLQYLFMDPVTRLPPQIEELKDLTIVNNQKNH